jgi:CheY-like chemotaxis protein
MSLTGNLEDLPLLDILQIVSFSKKTGFLSIQAEVGHGAIVFDGGFVVAAFTWQTPPIDPRARTLPPETRDTILRGRIEMALEQLIRMREGSFDFSLTEVAPLEVAGRDIEFELLSRGINAQELMLDLARGMDEDRRDSTAAVEASFAAPDAEGMDASPDMDADLDALLTPPPLPRASEPPPPPPPHLEPPPLPPRARPAAAAAVPVPAPVPVPVPVTGDPTSTLPLPPKAPGGGTILLVDDEADVRRVLGEHFTGAGYAVVEAEDPESAVRTGTALARAGTSFLLVVDLGMPTSGGTSFHGGFEAVRKLARADVKPAVLLMTESLTTPLQTRARELGIKSFVFKPGISKLDPEQFEADLKAFAAKIVADVLPRLVRPAVPVPVPVPVPVAPTKPPAAAPPPAPVPVPAKPAPAKPARVPSPLRAPAATADQLSRELAMLGQRLDELRRPQDATQIAALVMSVAREFFERSVLFLVKGDELRGVNGFGPTARGDALELLSRELVIPLSERSIFSDVVNARRGFTGPLPVSALTTDLLDGIGRLKGSDVALLPLVTQRESIAILYGDNPESGRPPGRLDSLRLFINQAGIALENAILHRKVHALTGQE